MNLPKWQCHKVVSAFLIEKIKWVATGEIELADLTGDLFTRVGAEYMQKHRPQRGGYYVRYADGYESWSPALAFEEGYTLMEEDNEETT